MRKQQCNRCGTRYRTSLGGGELTLKYGDTEINADICQSCYDEMVKTYNMEVKEE